MSGLATSPPSLCRSGPGSVELVIRSTDNRIYHKTFSNGAWSGIWDSAPGGATGDQPECAVIGNTMIVVIRGLDNGIYYSQLVIGSGIWQSSWFALSDGTHPGAISAPTLAPTPSLGRVDLMIRGADMGTYHRYYSTSRGWSPNWDIPGPVIHSQISDIPAAVSNGTSLHVVVRGTDNGAYYDTLSFTTNSWATSGWTYLSGTTISAPSLTFDPSGTVHLALRGQDNGIYHKSENAAGIWDAGWDTPGGSSASRPAIAMNGPNLALAVQGLDNLAWYNACISNAWQGWNWMGISASFAPSLENLAYYNTNPPPPSIVSVVAGSDNRLYSTVLTPSTWTPGSWSLPQYLGGSTSSPPAVCTSARNTVELVVRGIDDHIYHKTFSNGMWQADWDIAPAATTGDQPACGVNGSTLHLVIRGLDNGLYYTTFDLSTRTWTTSGWTFLDGYTASSPSLSDNSGRLDLVVRGLDNGVYHRFFQPPSGWNAQWDTPGPLGPCTTAPCSNAATSDIPAAAYNGGTLWIVIRGLDNGIYYARYQGGAWLTPKWTSLSGATFSAPTVMIENNTNTVQLVIRGTDDHIYHKSTSCGNWCLDWDSPPGGSTPSRPTIIMDGTNLALAVQGEDNLAWYDARVSNVWGNWSWMGISASLPPSLAAL